MLRLQTDHAVALARRYRGEPAILAWDLTDEPPFWIVGGQTNDAMAINWTRLISGALRRYDPAHLLCVGTSMEDVSHGPFRPDTIASEVDFFSVHPYSIYMPALFPDAMLSERGTYCGAFQTALSAGAGHPVVVHEYGASAAQYDPGRIAAFDRLTMYSSLANGANGLLAWCYTDAAPKTYLRAPYLRAPHETQFGLTTWDRQDRPAGSELRALSRLLANLNLEDVEPAPAEAALIVPHEWAAPQGDFSRLGLSGPSVIPYTSTQEGRHGWEANLWLMGSLLSAFILCRRAGFKPALPREYSDWEKHPLLLLPSPLTSTNTNLVHIHTGFWNKTREYLKSGGAVYASVCADAAIPEMEEIFGCALADHLPVEQAKLTLVEPFGDLRPGETFHFPGAGGDMRRWPATVNLFGGKVIAVDQDDRPALIVHGRALLCTYPIESYLATRPAAFDGEESTHRLYRALCVWAGIIPLFTTDQPSVEVGGLVGEASGYAILANHSPQSLTVIVTSRQDLASAAQATAEGWQPLPLSGRSWQMDLPAHGGAVVAWKQ
jgi:hypothetical protein